EAEAVALIRKAAEALAAVHELGLLHRDIKPDNLILNDDGRVVLIDFGTAREFAAERTHRMTAMLTPGYAPLEQYSQQGRFGPYTDIYALGATFYHLLTGQMPASALDRIQGVELLPPHRLNPAVSATVSAAVMWALEIPVKSRPPSVGAFLAALSRPAPARPPARVGKPPPPPLRLGGGEARSVAELAQLCDRYPDEALLHLFDRGLERWLAGALGEAALAQKARVLADARPRDGRRSLELLTRELLRASGQDASVRIIPEVQQLDLGTLPSGGKAVAPIPVRVEGRPRAWGGVEIRPELPGVIAPETFSIAGARGTIEIGLDTEETPPGEHEGTVVLTAEGAPAPVSIPIRYRVEPLKVSGAPQRLDLGRVRRGKPASVSMTLQPELADGRVWAQVEARPPLPGLKMAPTIRGNPAQLTVTLDPAALVPGREYETELVLEGNLGKVAVPLQFRVGTDWATVARSALTGAAWVAALLGLIRWALSMALGERWITHAEGPLPLLLIAGPLALLALLRLGALFERAGSPDGGAHQASGVGCLRLLSQASTIGGALVAAPFLAPGWVTGLDLVGQTWRGLGLGPPASWAASGALLGLVHGVAFGLTRAGRHPIARAVYWIGILLLLALLPLGWWGGR
ncbi:MAG TPA: serine/threonine-protein kinase, partial [Armatimonadota bacterium]|nr:serine/threonine-protein kinase [Armatimonadota bacterium]